MHNTSESRPWGSYKVIDEAPGFKVKRITVNPGQMLSLQYHEHRAEWWIVATGEAKVTVGMDTFTLQSGHSTYIQIGQKHRLTNEGSVKLELIELQLGERLEEADIHRLEDNYGRA
jgi:mannose-6-phosphate isomerase-like protein (cupin superfamily)